MVAHQSVCHAATLSKAFLKSLKTWYRSADVGSTFFTQNSKAEDLFCGVSSGSVPVLQQLSLQLGV